MTKQAARVLSLQPDGAARTWGSSTRATEASWVPVESLCDWRAFHQSQSRISVSDVFKPITRGKTGTERLTKINRNWCARNCRHYGFCQPCRAMTVQWTFWATMATHDSTCSKRLRAWCQPIVCQHGGTSSVGNDCHEILTNTCATL